MPDSNQAPGPNKKALREHALSLRLALPINTISLAICNHLNEWPEFREADTVLAYHPFKNEVDVLPLLEAHPRKAWHLPSVSEAVEGHMAFYRHLPGGKLQAGRFGIMEPEGASELIVPDNGNLLVLAPALMMDRHGYRLGYGKGFYDRFFSRLAAEGARHTTVGVVPAELLTDRLPTDDWDTPLDFIVAETGVFPVKKVP